MPRIARALAAAAALVLFLTGVPPAHAAEWVWPVRGEVITRFSNVDDPYAAGQHRGIDIAGEIGAPVVSAAGGQVRFAGTAGSSGLTVSVRTADGAYDLSYLHLASLAVRAGEQVQAGQPIGALGTSGRRSSERPHLHFGVRDAGTRHAYRDPLTLLPQPPGPAPSPDRPLPVPVAAPQPLAPAPAPEPAREPSGRRPPQRVPMPRRIPRGVPVRRPALPRPLGAPRVGPVPATVPDARPVARPVRPGARVPSRSPLPSLERRGPAAAPQRARPPREPSAPSQRLRPVPTPDAPATAQGPGLGLVLACAGLLLAAALLGLTADGRRSTRSGARRLSALLRPLAGRR